MTASKLPFKVKEESAPIKLVAIKDISVPKNRLRKPDPDKVKGLMESIERGELYQPILVRPKPKGRGYLLVFGGNRFEAIKKLGRKTIEARIKKLTDDEALIAEIEENLIRADLSKEQREDQTLMLKEAYLRAHPETKQGGSGGKKKDAKVAPFSEVHSNRTGRSKRQTARDVARAKLRRKIDKQAYVDLKFAGFTDDDSLKVCAKLPVAEQIERAAAVRAKCEHEALAKAGEAPKVDKGKSKKPAADPAETKPAAPNTGSAGNGNDPGEAAAKMKAAHEANAKKKDDAEEAAKAAAKAAENPKSAPSKSAKALEEFKVACNHWLPQLDNWDDRAEAVKFANEVLVANKLADTTGTAKPEEAAVA
jgi:uncharacterized ParB-like nuclease family protein